MTPVEMARQWLAAIGETEYDPELRERLLWDELLELQAAMDLHAQNRYELELYPESVSTKIRVHNSAIAIARELCDVAYVAIGTAKLMGIPPHDRALFPLICPPESTRDIRKAYCYSLFEWPGQMRPVCLLAAFYGFGDKLEACFAEVHRANMAKLECIACEGKGRIFGEDRAYTHECCVCNATGRIVNRTPDGKIIKPAGWQPPDLGPILFAEEQGR